MKKIIYIIILLISLISCKEKNYHNSLTILQGSWKINNDSSVLIIKDNQWEIIELVSKNEYRGYVFYPQNIPYIDTTNILLWCNNDSSGIIKIISFFNEKTVFLVKGVPYSINKIDTIYKINYY